MNSGGRTWFAGFRRAVLFTGVLVMGGSWAIAEEAERDVKAFKPQDWSYGGETGPGYWSELGFPLCLHGKKQSPVDFSVGRKTLTAHLDFTYRSSLLRLLNTGRTIRGIYEPGSTLKYGEKRYELTQFEFHTPSEHTLGGRTYPIEIQLLHRGEDGKRLQLAVFVTEGDAPANGTMEALFAALPLKSGLELIGNFYINAMDLLPREQTAFFYLGSLTTPPCTEGVTWFVYKEPIRLPAGLISRMVSLFAANTRPIQRMMIDKPTENRPKQKVLIDKPTDSRHKKPDVGRKPSPNR